MHLFQVQSRCFTYKKPPTLTLYRALLKKLLWILYFPTEQTISQCRVKGIKTQSDILWSRSPSYFYLVWAVKRFNTSSKQKTQLPLSLTKTPYWSPYSCSSLFHPLPWAYKLAWSVFWIRAENWSGWKLSVFGWIFFFLVYHFNLWRRLKIANMRQTIVIIR